MPIRLWIGCDQFLDCRIALFNETGEPAFGLALLLNPVAVTALQQFEVLADRLVVLCPQQLADQLMEQMASEVLGLRVAPFKEVVLFVLLTHELNSNALLKPRRFKRSRRLRGSFCASILKLLH